MNLFKIFVKYVTLNVLSMIALSCYILADTFFIANGLGPNGLTALNLAIPVYSFINGCGLMIGIGGSTRYSILTAKNDSLGASHVFTQSLLWGGIFSLLFVCIGIFLTDPLTLLLGADASVYDMTYIYLKIMLFFSPAFILNNIMNAFVRNDGSPELSMTAMVTGSLFNIIFDYILIFPLGLGMLGAILATGFSPLAGLIVLSRHFINSEKSEKSCIRIINTLPSCKCAFDIFSLGISAFITEVASGLVIIVFNLSILNLTGNIGVAAYGIIANLSLVVTFIFTGIAQGMQPIISRAHGNHSYQDIRIFFRYGIVLSLVLSVLIYAAVTLLHVPIIAAFNETGDSALFKIAKDGLFLYFTAFIFAGFNIISASLFSSADQPLQGFLISILRGFVLIIPSVLILSSILEMTGVWISFPVAEAVTMILAVGFVWKFWKKMESDR